MSFTAYYPSGTPGSIDEHSAATYYSYDIHGNVYELLQDFGRSNVESNVMNATGNRFKKITYNYDLISGKVNNVNYQPGQPDAFYHRYTYDAENRLTLVETSNDKVIWEKDARYTYYKHGPLARMVLGDLQVQGLDYAYNLQGWLKGINSTSVVDGNFDMGHDGKNVGSNADVARDVYGISLNYFDGDYRPIGGMTVNPFVSNSYSLMNNEGVNTANSLFNGNIASMIVNIPKLGDAKVYGYKYDQLNRIKSMDAFSGINNSANSFSPVANSDYKERVTYDPNGNILTYIRNGSAQGGQPLYMDSLTYQYEKNNSGQLISNKLRYVHDKVNSLAYAEDIDNQTTLLLSDVQVENLPSQPSDNYHYDAIGNLSKDVKEGIDTIIWNVYGKIERIEKADRTVIQYKYDAAGNRICKIVSGKETWYVRDAQGNVMSVYTKDTSINNNALSRIEAHIYGSSRIGMDTRRVNVEGSSMNTIWERGWKQYEETNHLGNVLATISDKKLPHDAGNGIIDYYRADIVTATDYYLGGMEMPERRYYYIGQYRFGFQNQEKDNEIYGGEGNAINYRFRVEDTRLGRFFSTDPLAKKYPFYSPYSFSGNRVIDAIELEGLEPYILFKTEKDAALNFGGQFNGKSIKLGVEFAANIYRKVAANGKTYYYYDEPNKGTADESRSSLGFIEWFKGGRKTSTIHSHGEYLPTYDNNNFSPQDNKGAESEGKTEYVTTPDGSLKKYNPTTKVTTTESTNLPSDPKDPARKNKITPLENAAPVKTTPIVPIKVPVKADPITPSNGGIM